MGRIKKFHAALTNPAPKTSSDARYEKLLQLNGQHPWQTVVPEGHVSYPVRRIDQGKLVYFNYDLAKEMGLISATHPEKMNADLESVIINTFGIRIVNEYDQSQNIRFHPSLMKAHPYMATRYLQLQHKNKRGMTSGDGRSVWNGTVQHNGKTWDVSSRGTGVTRLSPGAAAANRPLKSGDTKFGYGCGMADLDELVASAIYSEVLHNRGVHTERTLTIIDLGDGNGIGVRAGKNLFRPAHLFLFLKQERQAPLKNAVDFVIERQIENRRWRRPGPNVNKYDHFLNEVVRGFAQFIAQIDREYIFTWLDWDGDNVLIDAGIIDYGSIRQFGIRHDAYRYDDVDRFSTNLNEQRRKARGIVQTFAQLTDFLKTGRKRPIEHFRNHPAVVSYDQQVDRNILQYFLAQLGLNDIQIARVLSQNAPIALNAFRSYSRLERQKVRAKLRRVPDGVNRPALLNMRTILHDLPAYMAESKDHIELLPTETFFALTVAEATQERERRLTPALERLISKFQSSYLNLLTLVFGPSNLKRGLSEVAARTKSQHRPDRLTGDALLYIVDDILRLNRKRKAPGNIVQTAINAVIAHQLDPNWGSKRTPEYLEDLLAHIDDHRESI